MNSLSSKMQQLVIRQSFSCFIVVILLLKKNWIIGLQATETYKKKSRFMLARWHESYKENKSIAETTRGRWKRYDWQVEWAERKIEKRIRTVRAELIGEKD